MEGFLLAVGELAGVTDGSGGFRRDGFLKTFLQGIAEKEG